MPLSFDNITDTMILEQLGACKVSRVVLHQGSRDDYAQKEALAGEQLAGLKVADVRKQLDQTGRLTRVNDARVVIRRAIASVIAQGGLTDATILLDWE